MSEYTPDNWVVLFFNTKSPHYRVLVGWSGGYTTGDSWRMNSGITSVTEDDHHYLFHGHTGSVYRCHKNAYGLRRNNSYVWGELQERYGDKVEILDQHNNWTTFDWKVKYALL